MAPSSRDRISVDLRGLKAALIEQARSRGVSPSALIRALVAEDLGPSDPSISDRSASDRAAQSNDRVRMSLRMSKPNALAITQAARVAGLPLGAYVAGLVGGVPVLTRGAERGDHIATLVASSAELASLSRNLHHLTSLLSQGSVRAAQEYREMLDSVAQDVRDHLALASDVLADLRPRRRTTPVVRVPLA